MKKHDHWRMIWLSKKIKKTPTILRNRRYMNNWRWSHWLIIPSHRLTKNKAYNLNLSLFTSIVLISWLMLKVPLLIIIRGKKVPGLLDSKYPIQILVGGYCKEFFMKKVMDLMKILIFLIWINLQILVINYQKKILRIFNVWILILKTIFFHKLKIIK